MNWEALGAIGEIVGAVAVVVTLGYLAVQIRQNTRSMRTATRQNVLGDSISFLEHLFTDPELARVWGDGIRDSESLSEPERHRFHLFAMSFFRRFESIHQHHREGLLPTSDWAGLRDSVLEGVARPGLLAWWESNSFRFNPYFREFFADSLKDRVTQGSAEAGDR